MLHIKYEKPDTKVNVAGIFFDCIKTLAPVVIRQFDMNCVRMNVVV
jgi:hypothetical protein